MEKYLDRANISNSDVRSLEKIDKNGFALKQKTKEFEKLARISSENEENDALKLYEFIKEIYKEVNNGKEPRVKIRKHFPIGFGTKTSIIFFSIGAINIAVSIMFNDYANVAAVLLTFSLFNFLNQHTLAAYDKISKEFLINLPVVRKALDIIESYHPANKNVIKNSFIYAVAVHEVSHSIKTVKFTPKDLESAGVVVKEMIWNDDEFKPITLNEKIKWNLLHLILKPNEKEEFDKRIRQSIARGVYFLLKNQYSEFFNYFGEETDKLLFKVGAYIAKANPKELIESFKDEKGIIKTIESLEAKQKEV
jgi:hypothetical protein